MIKRLLFGLLLISYSFHVFAQDEVDWFNLLGKSHIDKEMADAFAYYGNSTSSLPRFDSRVQLNWEKEGLAISVDDFGRILSIYFMNDRYTINNITFTSFPRELPFKIKINMNPEEIIEVLGEPNIDEGEVYRRLFYKTNYEYEFLFKDGVIQYFRIGLLDNQIPK